MFKGVYSFIVLLGNMQAKSVRTIELTFLTQRVVATFLYCAGVCNSSFTPTSIAAPISISNLLSLPSSQ